MFYKEAILCNCASMDSTSASKRYDGTDCAAAWEIPPQDENLTFAAIHSSETAASWTEISFSFAPFSTTIY